MSTGNPERLSLRKAIDLKCKECIYDPIGGTGTWRQQVGACSSPKCPLFPVRPLPADLPVGDDPVTAPNSGSEPRSPYSLYPPKGSDPKAVNRGSFGA